MEKPVARFWREADPAAIEDELSALWGEVGRAGPVARPVMANLVVYTGGDSSCGTRVEAPALDAPFVEVARRHPSRVILLRHEGEEQPGSPVDSSIGILLFGSPASRFGVETITIRSSCARSSLPSIVRRLAFGDIPTSIWWTQDLCSVTPADSVIALGRQFIFDSRRWGDVLHGVLALLPLLARSRPVDLADLNWRRLTPLRQAITQAIGLMGSPGVIDVPRVEIRHAPGEAPLAWLLGGWICSRLPGARSVTVQEAAPSQTILSLTLGSILTASLDACHAVVTGANPAAALSIASPVETEADAVVAELRNLTCDPCLVDALVALPRLLAADRQ